ncbi:DUF6114 domain-containing protein [Actinoplanes sp. KI2]|uniref:DUF6114 domain-containing protein n=1 Tax=Actinoplanes sp. KI2 TaxID=2983315 RepID=UPI0021D56FBB|nr:DUF6114 domain-containing protein [Actinoplanes sp. KI2]MCU7728645.1 DUF6114 domain-containing protein [Actinoplanes sp. KI2]
MAATDGFWAKFRHWRRRRPFWGSLLLLLSGLEMFYTANQQLGNLEIHMGQQGFLSYVVPAVLILCGLLCMFTPAQRLFYGIIGTLTALYSFIGLNLGGFIVGMLLGILGGALVIAWGPPRSRPGDQIAEPPTDEPTDHQQDGPVDVGDEIFNQYGPRDIDETQRIEVAGHDDRPHDERPIRPAGQGAEPPTAEPPKASALQRVARNPRAMAVALIPLAVTATIVVAGSNLQARADDTCPDGLPSVATTTTAAAAKAATAKKTTAAAKKTTPALTKTTAAVKKTSAAAKSTAAAEKTTAAPTPTSEGNAVVDGIKDVVDGVGNLLGIGDESTAPSTSPATPETTAPETTPATTAPTTTAPAESSSSATTEPTADPTKTTASPTSSDDVIPCLGPRVIGKVASADDIPLVAKKPGVMEVDSLTLYNSTYDGVVDMPTAGGGSFKALKFTMDKAVNKPFKLTIDEKAGHQTVITSKELTTSGTVKFYTTELKGKLFGVIPVTFTPDQPPPLTLPVLWFTDVTVKLAYVRCDTLTGDPLKIEG